MKVRKCYPASYGCLAEQKMKQNGATRKDYAGGTMQKVERLDYLNGLKVLSFILVFNVHFLNAFYPGFYSLDPAVFHTSNQIEFLIGATPLDLIIAGKFSVKLFMIMSGFLAARRFFLTGDEKALSEGAFKKYFRLVLPVVAVNVLIVVAMYAGLYRNSEMAVIADSVDLFGNYNQFQPSILAALKEAMFGCFITGANSYNGPLWFLEYEFLGTLMVAAILALVGKKKARFLVYAVVCVIFVRTDFLAVLMGMILAELFYHDYKWVEKLKSKKWLMWLLLVGCLLVATYPPIGDYGNRLQGTIYALIPAKVMIYYIFGGTGLLFAVSALEPVKKFLSAKPFAWLSKISYCFYLVHFPIICTVTASVFLALYQKMNYHLLAVLCYVITVVVALTMSWLLTRFVEKPGIKMAEKLTKKLLS